MDDPRASSYIVVERGRRALIAEAQSPLFDPIDLCLVSHEACPV